MAATTNFGAGDTWEGAFTGGTAAERARSFARARRHTRLVKALRWSLPSGAFGVVALYVLMIMNTGGWTAVPSLDLPRIIPENLTMDNPRYEGFTKDGGSYVVKALTAVQDFANTEFVKLNGITGDMLDAKKSKTQLTAAHGNFNTKSNELELHGGIDITADSGMRAKLSRATILTRENVIFSKEPAVVELPSGTIRSNELRVLTKSREIAFVDDVKAHLVPDRAQPNAGGEKSNAPLIGGGEGPIDITANRLDIDDTGKTATFSGNVVAQQGDASLTTTSLEVHYEGGDVGSSSGTAAAGGAGTRISRIVSNAPVVMVRAPHDRVSGEHFEFDAAKEVAVVSGDVVMTSGPERRATSEKATVDQRADTILLTGNVIAVQGRNEMRGERLYVERGAGRTELSSPGNGGRIETRFYRGEAEKSAKQRVEQLAAGAASGAANVTSMFKTDPSAPIDVEASRLDVDDQKKVAVFRGDVLAKQGDFVLRTSELTAHYTGSAGLAEETGTGSTKAPAQISRIEARGKIVVASGDQKAVGDWANFDMKKNQAVLGGDVVLTQLKNVVRGTKLTIDMATGESKIHNEGAAWSATAAPSDSQGPGFVRRDGSRPSAIFYPRKKKDAEKKPSPGANGSSSASDADRGWAPAD